MSSRYYPLYQKGNPQLRIFLPNFWMKLIKPKEPLPPNMVLFLTSIQMTEYDVRNYLEKIYKVPVIDVKTSIKMGKIKKCFSRSNLIKEDDYKEALVTLPKQYNFIFPNLTIKKDKEGKNEKMRKTLEVLRQGKMENKDKPFIPSWFSR